jgi:paraquat-inducible protein A
LCGKKLHFRKPDSLQRCLAYLVTACILYIPANVLPIMRTISIGEVTDSTIIGGALLLWDNGEYPISIVIFVASVAVPILKILSIALLCWRVSVAAPSPTVQLHKLYDIAEVIGKWSMVDVFVVALLAALMQFGSVLTVQAGSAALAFAGVVIFTMLSARAFDARLIWDKENIKVEAGL